MNFSYFVWCFLSKRGHFQQKDSFQQNQLWRHGHVEMEFPGLVKKEDMEIPGVN